MKLDVKNLAFGAVGEIDNFDFSLDNYKIADELIATSPKGQIKLTRLDESILAQVEGEAALKLNCDRCLAEYPQAIPFDFAREYYLGGYREDTDDLLVSKHFEVDIEPQLQEELILALPVRKLCREECKGLCNRCGADLNQGQCHCGKKTNKKV